MTLQETLGIGIDPDSTATLQAVRDPEALLGMVAKIVPVFRGDKRVDYLERLDIDDAIALNTREDYYTALREEGESEILVQYLKAVDFRLMAMSGGIPSTWLDPDTPIVCGPEIVKVLDYHESLVELFRLGDEPLSTYHNSLGYCVVAEQPAREITSSQVEIQKTCSGVILALAALNELRYLRRTSAIDPSYQSPAIENEVLNHSTTVLQSVRCIKDRQGRSEHADRLNILCQYLLFQEGIIVDAINSSTPVE